MTLWCAQLVCALFITKDWKKQYIQIHDCSMNVFLLNVILSLGVHSIVMKRENGTTLSTSFPLLKIYYRILMQVASKEMYTLILNAVQRKKCHSRVLLMIHSLGAGCCMIFFLLLLKTWMISEELLPLLLLTYNSCFSKDQYALKTGKLLCR